MVVADKQEDNACIPNLTVNKYYGASYTNSVFAKPASGLGYE